MDGGTTKGGKHGRIRKGMEGENEEAEAANRRGEGKGEALGMLRGKTRASKKEDEGKNATAKQTCPEIIDVNKPGK